MIVRYDVNLDIKILRIIVSQEGERIPITHLKNYSEVHAQKLEEHLDHLVKWNMIVDTKPNGFGRTRMITFARHSTECINELNLIKEAVDKVNEYFGK